MSVIVRAELAMQTAREAEPEVIEAKRRTVGVAQDALAKRVHGAKRRIDPADRFETVPLLIMKLDEQELGRLLRDPAVESVELDRPLKLVPRLAEMRAITKIESIWPVDRGNEGKGKLIAIIDSGLDSDIPELKGRVVAENCGSSEPDCYNPKTGQFDTSRSS